MNKEIKKILKDIYLTDKDLKKQEDKLIKIIQELLLSRPDSKIDDNFISELRTRVVGKKDFSFQKDMLKKIFNQKLAYAFSGLAIVILAIVVSMNFFGRENGELVENQVDKIKNVGEKAFGEIYFAESQTNSDNQKLGLGGGSISENADAPISIMPPQIINYNYVYKGEEFTVNENEVLVYKKAFSNSISQNFQGLLSGVNSDLINFNSFQNKKINSLEIIEDKQYGYSIRFDSRNNLISINMNWENWPQQDFGENSKISEISNEQAINIADSFMNSYGVDLSNHGSAEVVKPSGQAIILSENKTIVYPVKIDGKFVYDYGGRKTGINVNVSSRFKKVISAYNISQNNFESSKYAPETNIEKIIASAEKGGMNPVYEGDREVQETIEVELGTPTQELVRIWNASEDRSTGEELYVPSLIFPVISENNKIYQKTVIVPIVGEMIK